jgi:hypothetical protein
VIIATLGYKKNALGGQTAAQRRTGKGVKGLSLEKHAMQFLHTGYF